MGNKRLKKREHSLKGLGRRGLSLLMAMVMTLSLVQISAFAEEDVAENQPNPLEPETVKNVNGHGIDLTKTAERVGDTEWEVTVRADIGDTKIKQQPLDVVFVLDKSGSMMFCTDPDHDKGDHEHGMWCYKSVWVEDDSLLGGHYERQLTCTKKEVRHEVEGGWGDATDWLPCRYKDENGKWVNYETRLESAKAAMTALENSLPAGANVQYVSFSDDAKQENSLNDVVADGGTNIMAGVDKGIDLLNQNQSTVTKKVLVLLSDGEATAGGEYGNRYTSSTYRDFIKNKKNDVYTVGFALDNPKLAEMAKGDGEYIYAKNAEALNSAFTELSTRISAMIVDPMGNDVTYVSGSAKDGPKENEDFKTVKGNITLDSDGRTLRWTPMDTDSFSNTVIQYTYRVKLNPSKDAGNYTGIKLNNPTYLQYGIEQNGNKTAYTGQFNIPEGFYKVSTLEEQFKVLDENGNASEITDSVQKPHDIQSKVTDYGMTDLEVYAPTQALDTRDDEHVKYVYHHSELDGKEINVKDAEDNNTLEYIDEYASHTMDVTNDDRPHTLVHYYTREFVNSVEYVYDNDPMPEGLKPDVDLPEKEWFKQGSEQTIFQNPQDENGKYNFSGWDTTDEIGEVKDGKFTLNTDVTFHGSWTIKPNYRIVANYYTITDKDVKNRHLDNTEGVMPLGDTVYMDTDDVTEELVTDNFFKFSGEKYDEMLLGDGNPDGLGLKNGSTVTGIKPVATDEGTVIRVYFYRYVKSPASYTVTHEYYNVDPDGKREKVGDSVVETKKGVHEDVVAADSIATDTKNGEYEVVRRSGDIKLDKNANPLPNITIEYNHYQYRVTTEGDNGVASLTETKVYNKGNTAQVKFTLKDGYQVKSVTDNTTGVTIQAKNGTYNIGNINENHTVVVTTEQIKYKLTVKYVFADGSTPDGYGPNLVGDQYTYGKEYEVEPKEAPEGYYYTGNYDGQPKGTITKDTEVTFHYAKNSVVYVNYYLKDSDPLETVRDRCSREGTPGQEFHLDELKTASITTSDGKIYDLVSTDVSMDGVFVKDEAIKINLYYAERAKVKLTINYVSENSAYPLTYASKSEDVYLNAEYNLTHISGSYIPEDIPETSRTWHYSGDDMLKITGAKTLVKEENIIVMPTGDCTITVYYYLDPTYQVKATYITVNNGTPDKEPQVVVTAKEIGTVGANIPFDKSEYDTKHDGFTYQNDLKVNDTEADAAKMPVMEKFGEYLVTLSYKKTVNSGVSTTINHVFRTILDGEVVEDTTTAPNDTVTETWGQTVDMSKYSKAGQAGYQGYTVEKYSADDGKLRAGENGTIYYVREQVTVVFKMNGGTWNNSLNDVTYKVTKGSGLDRNGEQPIPAPTPSDDKYEFDYWKAEPSTAFPEDNFYQHTVFIAQWKTKSPTAVNYFYTVTYNYTVTTDGTVTYQDSVKTGVQETTKVNQTITSPTTATRNGYTFDLASPAEQTADLTGTTREAPHQFVVNYVLTVNNNGGGGRDDRDDDRPAPKPDPDTEIKDDDVPKTDLPEQPVEIPDEDTPKTDLPQAPVDIPDEDTPKADVPKTGDTMGLWVMAAVASGAGLVWLNLTGKKRKDDNG